MNKILIIHAHPKAHKSRINGALLDAIQKIDQVSVRRLYEMYPDFHIDIQEEQKALSEHNIIIFQHPFYWYSAPSLLKEWIDLVFEHGFAFGSKGNALKGKKVITATTTGGSAEAYTEGGHNHFTVPQLLAPFKATVNLCKMTYLPPFVIHGGLLINDEKITEAAQKYKEFILNIRDGNFDEKEIMNRECWLKVN